MSDTPTPGPIRSTKLTQVSVSQVDTFSKCPRKWFYNSILKIRQPETRSQRLGTEFHAILENYTLTGELRPPDPEFPEALEMAQAALDHIPKHGTKQGLMAEHEFWLDTYEGGPKWMGYIDLVIPDVEIGPDEIKEHPVPVGKAILGAELDDYKSRSDHKYNKTPEELLEDTQFGAYAKWAFSCSDYEFIRAKHINVNTRGRKKAVPISVVLTRAQAEKIWQRDLEKVRKMAYWAEVAPDADFVPPNTSHCNEYGGCFYRDKCGVEPVQKFDRGGEARKMTLKELIAKQKEAATSAPAQPVAPAAPPATASTAAATTAPPAAVVNPLKALLASQSQANAAAAPAADPAVLPPDAPSRVSTPEEVAAANGEVPVAAAPPADTSAPATETAEPAKRKRRTKAEMEAARAAEAAAKEAPPETSAAAPVEIPVTINVEGQKVAETTVTTPADEPSACPTQVIFVDCIPSKGYKDAVHLEDVLPPLAQLAADGYNIAPENDGKPKVTHWKMIPYGGGPAWLSTAIQLSLSTMPRHVIVDSRVPGAESFLSEVGPHAKVIVRGVR